MLSIHVDGERCKNALGCRKCIEVCQGGVFFTYPRKPRTKTTKASHWVVKPTLISYCDLCNLCVEACPEQAITISRKA